MSRILQLDSPVVRAVSRIGDLAVLSMEWFLGCLPLVTIGASTSALYTAIHRSFSQQEGIAAVEFLKAFRSNFRQATLTFLPLGCLELLLLAECFLTDYLQENNNFWGNLRPLFLVLACVNALWMLYAAAYSARYQDTVRKTLRLSAVLALANPTGSIALMAVLCLMLFLLPVFPFCILAFPALYIWLAHRLLEPVFAKYPTEGDQTT